MDLNQYKSEEIKTQAQKNESVNKNQTDYINQEKKHTPQVDSMGYPLQKNSNITAEKKPLFGKVNFSEGMFSHMLKDPLPDSIFLGKNKDTEVMSKTEINELTNSNLDMVEYFEKDPHKIAAWLRGHAKEKGATDSFQAVVEAYDSFVNCNDLIAFESAVLNLNMHMNNYLNTHKRPHSTKGKQRVNMLTGIRDNIEELTIKLKWESLKERTAGISSIGKSVLDQYEQIEKGYSKEIENSAHFPRTVQTLMKPATQGSTNAEKNKAWNKEYADSVANLQIALNDLKNANDSDSESKKALEEKVNKAREARKPFLDELVYEVINFPIEKITRFAEDPTYYLENFETLRRLANFDLFFSDTVKFKLDDKYFKDLEENDPDAYELFSQKSSLFAQVKSYGDMMLNMSTGYSVNQQAFSNTRQDMKNLTISKNIYNTALESAKSAQEVYNLPVHHRSETYQSLYRENPELTDSMEYLRKMDPIEVHREMVDNYEAIDKILNRFAKGEANQITVPSEDEAKNIYESGSPEEKLALYVALRYLDNVGILSQIPPLYKKTYSDLYSHFNSLNEEESRHLGMLLASYNTISKEKYFADYNKSESKKEGKDDDAIDSRLAAHLEASKTRYGLLWENFGEISQIFMDNPYIGIVSALVINNTQDLDTFKENAKIISKGYEQYLKDRRSRKLDKDYNDKWNKIIKESTLLAGNIGK